MNKLIVSLVLFYLLVLAPAYAQTVYPMLVKSHEEFQHAIGGDGEDECIKILEVKDKEKGYLFSGNTQGVGAGKRDFYLSRIDSVGKLMWTKTYGGKDNEFGGFVEKTNDDNFVIVGYTESFNKDNNQILLIKVDPKGAVLWSKTIGLDRSVYATTLTVVRDGGFVILGETINNTSKIKHSDILVTKTDKDGNILWSKIIGGERTDYGYSISETIDHGYIIGGETNSFGKGDWDFYFLKLKESGDIEWTRAFGTDSSDYGRVAKQAPDGTFILGGTCVTGKDVDMEIGLVRVDANGGLLWSKTMGGQNAEYLLDLITLDELSFAIGGYTSSFGLNQEDAFICILDYNGKMKWMKTYGGPQEDHGVALCKTTNEGIILAGQTSSFSAKAKDVMLIKTTRKWSKYQCNANVVVPTSEKFTSKVLYGGTQTEVRMNLYDVDISISDVKFSERTLCVPY
ncbi:MAG: hypothetical protein J7604_17405 [Sporocytophaga sp.]|uniref:hypothetical protein n=1 Tax=Sporocytophaga sp. TaxID=2231183 RepID=UPI001B1E18F2|nr:hypothetical protein [Sporocytophaga sp.]MBO9701988.1 hypothetical protein [Sporocytophaga sp.]